MARKRHGKSSQYSRCSYSHNLPKKGRHISTSIFAEIVANGGRDQCGREMPRPMASTASE